MFIKVWKTFFGILKNIFKIPLLIAYILNLKLSIDKFDIDSLFYEKLVLKCIKYEL